MYTAAGTNFDTGKFLVSFLENTVRVPFLGFKSWVGPNVLENVDIFLRLQRKRWTYIVVVV